MQDKKTYVRLNHLVKVFPVSKATIWNYVKDGKIKSYKASAGVTIFILEDVEKLLLGGSLWIQ